MNALPRELAIPTGDDGLAERILSGEVVILRHALQELDLFAPLVRTSLEGIRGRLGSQLADRIEQAGFERIHEFVDPAAIPELTEAVYRSVTRDAPRFLERFVSRVFPGKGSYYFERVPNVRFHIPYDLAAPHRRQYDEFARRHGQGKIAPHGPHRDSWLDCPDNVVNAWIAVGSVQPGNGLSIFADNYRSELAFRNCGEVADHERLEPPLNFDLKPGDVLLFHSDHLHASELNRTHATRFVVSYRIAFGKPHFPRGHYNHYVHGGLAGGPLRWLAGIPADLQWSYARYRLRWAGSKLAGSFVRNRGSARRSHERATDAAAVAAAEPLSLADFRQGTIRPVNGGVCVARLGRDEFVAFGRRCPHQGADLATGFVRDGAIVCPWHNLTFDPRTGASPCHSLQPLKRFACDVKDDRLHVQGRVASTRSSEARQ